jgi:hypothetical protein
MKKTIFLIFLLSAAVFAQQNFEIKNASKNFDASFAVESCDESFCRGKITFSLFRKGEKKPFQIIKFPDSEFMLEEAKLTNAKLMYDAQSVVFFEDYNFDGREDLALRDGNNSGYGGPSYQIYLYVAQSGKFIKSRPFTDLAQGEYLGMFEVDQKKKVLRSFSKSGCCWHQTREFIVTGNRPKKVFEETEDATIPDERKVKITAKILVKGKWQTRVKFVKREEQ